MGCVSHPVLHTSSNDSVVAGWAGFILGSADQWRATQPFLTFGQLVLIGEDLDWGAELTHHGAASSPHLVPGNAAGPVSGWRSRRAGLPQHASNKIGKGAPLSSLQGLPDEKDCLWFGCGSQHLRRGAHVCEDLLVNMCIAHVTG